MTYLLPPSAHTRSAPHNTRNPPTHTHTQPGVAGPGPARRQRRDVRPPGCGERAARCFADHPGSLWREPGAGPPDSRHHARWGRGRTRPQPPGAHAGPHAPRGLGGDVGRRREGHRRLAERRGRPIAPLRGGAGRVRRQVPRAAPLRRHEVSDRVAQPPRAQAINTKRTCSCLTHHSSTTALDWLRGRWPISACVSPAHLCPPFACLTRVLRAHPRGLSTAVLCITTTGEISRWRGRGPSLAAALGERAAGPSRRCVCLGS